MPACVQELHASATVLPGADRRRRDQPRLRLPHRCTPAARTPTRSTSRASSTARTPSRARGDGPADRRGRARGAGAKLRAGATAFREKGEAPVEEVDLDRRLGPLAARTDVPDPDAAVLGRAGDRGDLDEVYRHLDTHVLFKLHWGGRASRARPGRRCCARTSARAWSGCGASRPTCIRARCSATSPATRSATSSSCWTPRTAGDASSTRFVFPRQPKGDRICLADFYRPASTASATARARRDRGAGGDRRLEVTELMARSRPTASSPSSCSSTASACRPPRGWPSGCTRACARCSASPTQGRRYSWGYPACPSSQSTRRSRSCSTRRADRHAPHRRLRARARAVDARLVAHHPQAIYFGMKPDGRGGELDRRGVHRAQAPVTSRHDMPSLAAARAFPSGSRS
jgi:5-methyltetrahydrofolate--homocysteine methyltransferase